MEYVLTFVKKGSPRGSIDKNLSRKLSSLKKRSFFEEKQIKMNATSKLLKHRSNQHIKLSKTSLNIYAKHSEIQKHTHTQ